MTPKRLEQSYRQTYRRLIAMVFAYLLVVVVAGIALLINHPRTADWVSQAVQAEFATANAPPSR
jgi:hypothetical protein